MTARRPARLAAALLALAAFTGCAHQATAAGYGGYGGYGGYDGRSAGDSWRAENHRDQRSGYGTVIGIAESDRDASSNPQVGAGAVLGGAVGAVIGRKIGTSVEAKNAGTVIGAVLGAMAGHQIERSRGKRDQISVTVRLDNGATVTLAQDRNEDLRVGDRVQIVDNRITRSARRGPRDLEYGPA